ncbi:hypothetical protein [Kibdelosporangium philippinense]|uniref:hypothetical protein n=1 Tax=Kibdelosporangium philippinense TaxID=211113 RepID=UPI0036202492
MPSYRRPTDLPPRMRDLNDALHDLHECAGLPSTRNLSKAILLDDRLSTTASHERVRSAFSNLTLPSWDLVQALVTVLCPDAGRGPCETELEHFRSLWRSALREARGDAQLPKPAELSVQQTSDHRDSWLPATGRTRFSLNMTKALADQLTEAFASMPTQALSAESFATIEPRPGVYQLFHHGQLTYVGKDRSLPTGLVRAARKISGRCASPRSVET